MKQTVNLLRRRRRCITMDREVICFMKDPRLEQLANLLLTQSLKLQPGEIFAINSGAAANPLNKALLRAAKAKGLYPVMRLSDASSPVCFTTASTRNIRRPCSRILKSRSLGN